MGIIIDHVAIPTLDPARAARWLGELLDLPVVVDGPDGEFQTLRLEQDASLFFAPATQVTPVHLALRVPRGELEAIIARLKARAIPFGNDPEEPANGRHDDPIGGLGRLYFTTPDGHLLEVCA